MKHRTFFTVAVLTFLIVPATLFLAQAPVPAIAYDAVDFLKPPANLPVGEVAGVATSSNGHVYVYTRTGPFNITVGTSRTFPHGSSRLLEFDQNGKFVREIGRDIYAFAYAQSVRIDPQNNIWIVDQYSNMAVKFDPEGRVLLTFGRRPETSRVPNVTLATPAAAAPAGAPAAPAAGAGRGGGAPPAGGAGAAGAAGAAGRGGGAPALPGGQAGGGAGAGAGVGAGGGAARGAAPAAGAAAGAAPRGGGGGAAAGTPGDSFNRPTDVAWDAAGNIFVADGFGNSRILKMDKNGKFVKTIGGRGNEPGQFNMLASIAVDAKGNLYVADKGNDRIQILDNDGNPKAQIKNIGSPAAICISPGVHQYLYSSNSNNPDDLERGEIYKMELDGTIVGKFGRAGHLVKEFGSVNSIDCRTENVLYVGELINWRVQKVTLRAK